MEPLFMIPIYKDYIWGGTKLKDYLQKEVPFETVAEAWEVSTNAAGLSEVEIEKGTKTTLKELFDNTEKRIEIFGTKTKDMERFPLLIKFIDAKDNLSVQVHPDDAYALEHENDTGKTEMWYIMECDENASIICGLKETVTQEQIPDMITNGKIQNYLNKVPIHKGDVIYIPAGTVHAILKGTLICEIQQNSNLTYRVYDWDRVGKDGKPRELHIKKAMDVIKQNKRQNITSTSGQEDICKTVIDSDYFKVDVLNITENYQAKSRKDTFEAYMVVEGKGKLETKGKEYDIKIGESFILPASLGEYEIKGNIKLLKAYL